MNAKYIKQVAPYIICALVALPVAVILTFMLSPFWGWFEAVSGIESMGHSGPSDWCFIVIYVTLVAVSVICYWTRKRRA